MNAADLLKMIETRYQPPEWAVLRELHDGTGANAKRRFDAVAFNCWPSSQFLRLGFEVKVSRGDFSRELADHEKRAALEKHCHEVYFVVSAGVCTAREVPEPWGLLEVRGDRLHCTRKAAHRKVGPVAETLAVCAIRRMTEAAIAEASRHYKLDGLDLTQADLDAFVGDKMSGAHASIVMREAKVRADKEELDRQRQAFTDQTAAWWCCWRDIEAAAKGWHRHDWRLPAELSPPTRAQIDEAINRIRLQGAADLEQRLRAVHASVGAALEAFTPAHEPAEGITS